MQFHRKITSGLSTVSILALAVALSSSSAYATTYQVGPSRTMKTLQAVTKLLKPGDVVELDGGATYPGGVYFKEHGTAAQKITIRGIPQGGARPIIAGDGGSSVPDPGFGALLLGNHYVIEGLEFTGSPASCLLHKADDVTLRDSVVHDCTGGHGILSSDDGSGSLTLDRVEFYKSGSGDRRHQVYIATDEVTYPGSVFRMQNCYVHDGAGGNNVKSRAERNEIYFNWIEGAMYHQLELIGPDGGITPQREDSDIVGNVIVGTSSQKWHMVRIGGDTEDTATQGRYNFANNTFISIGNVSVIRVFAEIDSASFSNNLFHQKSGSTPILSVGSATWTSGTRTISGTNNFVTSTGFSAIPAASEWAGTVQAADPGFTDLAQWDLRPAANSALIDKGVDTPSQAPGHEVKNPLAVPSSSPLRGLGPAIARPVSGKRDIGAYEVGTGSPLGQSGGSAGGASGGANVGGPSTGGAGSTGSTGGGSTGGSGAGTSTGSTNNGSAGGSTSDQGLSTYSGEEDSSASSSSDQGCSAASTRGSRSSAAWVAMAAVLGVLARKRRRA